PIRWIGLGLMLAAATGVGSWLFGKPFLTSAHTTINIPLLGELHLVSATFFDLGVFLLVVGATVLMLIAIAHQSIRRPREADAAVDLPDDEDDLNDEEGN